MSTITTIPATAVETFKSVDDSEVNALLAEELTAFGRKIVVLDDDPTGVQTVHGVSVYTDWSEESIAQGFDEEKSIFFILTNSRAFTAQETTDVHQDIAQKVCSVGAAKKKDFIVISRSDSTLRGHYPLETEVLRDKIEAVSSKKFHGEVVIPFFREGGRFTIDDVHYVQEGDGLTPCGMTEFAKDKSFGYESSHLGEWCEEKTGGKYSASNVISISLSDLRALKFDEIERQLLGVENFNKVIVNAVDYIDVKIFAIALIRAMRNGKEFLFRSAAALTKVLGGIPDKPLLTKQELVAPGNDYGGIVLVGSHVAKTTQQLEDLKNCAYPIEFIEFNQHLVVSEEGLEPEVNRVIPLAESKIRQGETVAIFTKRERFDLPTSDKDEQLKISVKISNAVTSIIGKLSIKPNFIIAKGGITSSDIGIKALKVQQAEVMGQIKPGVPVWMTGPESKFPNMPYIIFPGNVGAATTLREAVETLMG